MSFQTKQLERKKSESSNTSDKTISTDNTSSAFVKKRHILFQRKIRSRFNFTENPEEMREEDIVIIPEPLVELISLKISTHNYFKSFKLEEIYKSAVEIQPFLTLN